MLLSGLVSELQTLLPGLVLFTAGSVQAFLDLGQDVDLVLLDVRLEDGSDVEDNVSALLRAGAPCLLYTRETRTSTLSRALRAGARGIVPKSEDAVMLAAAVREVLDGGFVLNSEWAAAIAADSAWARPNLSAQQQRALQLYAAGLPMKTVARQLDVSIDTAHEYLRRVRQKYTQAGRPAPSKTDLYIRAVEDGYLPPPEPH